MSRRFPERVETTVSGRLTPWQLGLLLVTLGAAEGSTEVNRLISPIARQDVWLSILVAIPVGLIAVWLLTGLAARYPGHDLGAILRRLLGPFAYPLGVAFMLLFMVDAAESAATFTSLSSGIFPTTPPSAFLVPLVGVAVYGCFLGVEVIARVNSAVLLFADIPLGILLAVVFAPQQKLVRVLPVLANGWWPVLIGSQLVLGVWGMFVVVLNFLPLTDSEAKSRTCCLWAVIIVAVMEVGHNLGPILIFGPATAQMTWPSWTEVRVAEIGQFVERLDIVAIFLYVHGFWLELSAFIYASAQTASSLFGLRSHKVLLLPLGLAIFLGALAIPTQDVSEALRWNLTARAFVGLGLIVPALLLGWAYLREGRARVTTSDKHTKVHG